MPTKLGQNFLVNKDIVKKIVEAANLTADDLVLEIGPGKGILTEELAKRAGKVVAVEIDGNLVKILQKKFADNKKVEVVNEDILKIDISKLLRHPMSLDQNDQKASHVIGSYKLIANIPYYITAPIIRKFLESDLPPSEMILMVQKEVAERICSSAGNMSILAVSVQYYAKPEILFNVPRGNFDPVPEVDSAVIHIAHNAKHITHNIEETKHFFQVVRAGFSAKRKMLVNNLANSFHLEKKEALEKLKTAGISPTARAQELSVENWKKLLNLF